MNSKTDRETMEAATQPLLSNPNYTLLPADVRRYPTRTFLHENDIVIPLAIATWFGGAHDPDDDGRTASGKRTDLPGGIVGCALPMPMARGCSGTPIPGLPYGTKVRVAIGERSVEIPLIDVGPSGGLPSEAIIDLTKEAWELLLARTLTIAKCRSMEKFVSVLIPNVRQYLTDYWPRNANRVKPEVWPPSPRR